MKNCFRDILLISLFLIICTPVYAWKISAGTVTMNDPTVTAGFQTVSFTGSFFDVAPVVFVLAENSEAEPRDIRIRAVTTGGFEIIQVRPTVCGSCADAGNFGTPTVSWIAIEPGRHALPGGDIIEVGTVLTNTSQTKLGGTTGLDNINFSSAFPSGPIAMVGQVQTENNAVSTTGGTTSPFLTTVIQNANVSGFDIALELSEVSVAPAAAQETIGWLAAPGGLTDTLTDTGAGSVLIEAILSADNITNACSVDNNFNNTYGSNPLVVASKNRRDGIDGGWVRQCQINTSAVRLKVQEDEGADTEVNHTTESAGIFVVERAFDAEVIDTTPVASAEWRMDEFSWTGTTGEVADETATFNATALNGAQTSDANPAIAGRPGTCYYGTFPFNNTASPPVAVDTGVNIDSDIGNAGTITMWYFSNADWNGGGDRQLLDAGFNAASGGPKYFFLTLQNGGNLRFGYEDSVDGDWRINSPAQTFVAGEWVHIAVTWDLPNDMQAIFINGVQVATGTGNTNGVMGELNNLFIGDNNGEYIVGGDTTPNSANGGIDEVRIYNTALNATEITNIRSETHDCQSDLFFEVASVTLNDTNTTSSFRSVNFRQTYPSAPLVFALPTNTDTDPAALRIRNVTTTGFEIAQVEPESLDGRQNAMTVDYIAIMPGENILPDGTTIEAGTHTTTSVQHGSGVPGGEAWDTVNFTSGTPFSSPSVLLQIQGLANEYNNPPTTTSRPWLTASIQNVGNTSFQTALERSEVNDGAAGTISVNETIAYLAINGGVQGSFTAEGKTILYESINSADNINGWDDENCAGNVGQSIAFVNSYSSTPLAIAHTRRHDGGDGGWIVRCSIDAAQIGLAFDEDIFRDAERNHTTEQASILVFSEEFCYPTCVATTVHHYAISYPLGTPGVTCEAQAVRITAHDNVDAAVVPSGTTTITLSTTPAADSWALRAGGGMFTPPNQYTFDGVENFVDLWLTETTATTVPHIDIDVTDGTATDQDGLAEDDNIQFADAVFRFFADGTGEGIGTQIAGKESDVNPDMQTIQLRSVITNTDTMACESRITGSTAIDMAYKCNNPTTCQAAPRVQITTPAPASFDITDSNDNADTVNATMGNYNAATLDFGVTGTATFSFDFDDAGQIQLFARETLAAIAPDPAITVFGASNSFVVKPAGLCVESTDTNSDCVSGDGTCSAFKKAGSVNAENFFNLTVSGVTWETVGETDSDFCSGTNVTTPNFQLNSIALTHSKIAPTGGTSQLGTLEETNLNIAPLDNGAHTEANQAISEVGVFSITATPPAYLGETIAASSSANIGRFYPDRFNVTMPSTPAFADSCSGFTYLDQPFYYGTAPVLRIEALNSNGVTTNNYGGTFWKLTGSTLPRNYIDGSVVPPTASFTSSTGGSITLAGDADFDGIGTLALQTGASADEFMYQKGIPEGVFTADVDVTFLSTGFEDTDHTPPTSLVCYDATNDGTCDDFPYTMIQGTGFRWGRLVIGSNSGSELLPINLTMRTEYYNGTEFDDNSLDNCTDISVSDLILSNAIEAAQTDGDIVVNNTCGGSAVSTASLAVPVPSAFNSGEKIYTFSGPDYPPVGVDAGCVGYIDVTTDIAVGSGNEFWLQYDWSDTDQLDNGPYTENPNGRVDFGLFEGPSQYIYIREPW